LERGALDVFEHEVRRVLTMAVGQQPNDRGVSGALEATGLFVEPRGGPQIRPALLDYLDRYRTPEVEAPAEPELAAPSFGEELDQLCVEAKTGGGGG
jgi:hypothetical protein